MIEHCVAFFQKKQKDELYRIYITDSLKAIAETLGKTYGGSSPKYRYIEYFPVDESMAKMAKDETRTSQEIIGNIKDKLSKMAGD